MRFRDIVCCLIMILIAVVPVSAQDTPPPITPENVAQLTRLNTIGRGNPHDIALSPDGQTLVVSSTTGLYLYDTTDFTTEPFTFLEDDLVSTVEFSPAGDRLAVAHGLVEIWDMATHEISRKIEPDEFYFADLIVFSPDGTQIAVSWLLQEIVTVHDAFTGELVYALEPSDDHIYAMTFNPTGTRLAASQNDLIRIWDMQTGTLVQELVGHDHLVVSLDYAPNGQQLVSGDNFGNILLWDTATGAYQELPVDPYDSDSAGELRFNAQGDRILALMNDGRLDEWDSTTLAQHSSRNTNLQNAGNMTINEAADLIAITNRSQVTVWHLTTGALIADLSGFVGIIQCMAFHPNNESLVIGTSDDRLTEWPVPRDQTIVTTPLAQIKHQSTDLRNFAFSPDKTRYAVGNQHGAVELRPIADSQADPLMLEPSDSEGYRALNKIDFSPDSTLLAAAYSDGSAIIWETEHGDIIREWQADPDELTTLAFSPDGQLLATGGIDMITRIWKVTSGNLLLELNINYNFVNDIEFSPDGTRLAITAGYIDTIVWDMRTGDQLFTVGRGIAADFSPDGQLLATFTYGESVSQGLLAVWDARDGTQLFTSEANEGTLFDLTFSPDGTLLATRDSDTVLLWGIPTE